MEQPNQAEPLDAVSRQLWADRFAPILGEDERVELVVKAAKIVPAIGYVALTDRRVVALPTRPRATTTASPSLPLDVIAEVSFRGRKLDIVDPAGDVTRFGTIDAAGVAPLRAALEPVVARVATGRLRRERVDAGTERRWPGVTFAGAAPGRRTVVEILRECGDHGYPKVVLSTAGASLVMWHDRVGVLKIDGIAGTQARKTGRNGVNIYRIEDVLSLSSWGAGFMRMSLTINALGAPGWDGEIKSLTRMPNGMLVAATDYYTIKSHVDEFDRRARALHERERKDKRL